MVPAADTAGGEVNSLATIVVVVLLAVIAIQVVGVGLAPPRLRFPDPRSRLVRPARPPHRNRRMTRSSSSSVNPRPSVSRDDSSAPAR